jgi:ethanolamine ammonia-lyase small subunit
MSELARSSLAARLRSFTPARVGLGRTGVSQQTRDLLAFQQCHAQARDAVHAALQPDILAASISAITGSEVLRLHSAAANRAVYLQRPDLGRTLDDRSADLLAAISTGLFDIALIVADGLSAIAVERHACALIAALWPMLAGRRLAPCCVVEQARVAIGDPIGETLHAEISVVLIGERPGLSSPDSLGAYITWQPRPGRSDAERNCISNIRAEGLGFAEAAAQIKSYLDEARRLRLTGVGLKLNSPARLERQALS